MAKSLSSAMEQEDPVSTHRRAGLSFMFPEKPLAYNANVPNPPDLSPPLL